MEKLIGMFDVIDISKKEWEKEQYQNVEFGKIVVTIADKKHKKIATTFQNLMPMPRLIDMEGKNFDEGLAQIIKIMEEAGATVVLLNQSLYA